LDNDETFQELTDSKTEEKEEVGIETHEPQPEIDSEKIAHEKESEKAETRERIQKMEEMEAVMNKGMDFLSGLFKMSTGKDLNKGDNKIEIDRETGEVVMRFKMDL